ncbi:MAG: NAD-dependent epimerase/dehydratase family protein [Nitrosopumilus sp.]
MRFSKDTKVLVTGASGFIGSRLVKKLTDCNSQVFSIVRNNKNENLQGKVIHADLAINPIKLPDEKFDVVYHLASLTPHEKNKKILEQVNYEGTKNLFEAVKNKTKSIVYITGLTVFDSKYNEIDEDTPINPDTYFTKIRVMAQQYLEKQCKKNNIEYTVAHVGDIVYGDGGFFMQDMVHRLKKNRFRIPGDGMYVKNYIHVNDVVGALLAIIEKNQTNQSFIITGSNPAPFKDFVYSISTQIGIRNPKNIPEFLAKIAIGKDLVNLLTRSTKASNKKLKKIYDFQYPEFQEGIKEVFRDKKSV